MGAITALRSRSLREGLLKGRRGWFAVGVVMWSVRLVRLVMTRRPQVLSVEKVAPGQSVAVSAVSPSRRRRA